MKSLIFYLLLIPIVAISQVFEPSQVMFSYYSLSNSSMTSTLLNPEYADFKQDSIILGWHWDATERITRGLLANQNDAYPNYIDQNESTRFPDYCNLFMKLKYPPPSEQCIFTHSGGGEVLNARGLTYSPYYLINDDNINNFEPNINNSLNPIWGFKEIRGYKDEDLGLLVLDDNDKSLTLPVLSEPWPANHLAYFSGADNLSPDVIRDYLGYSFYISITLKRDGDCNLGGLDGDNVLKVEMPYYLNDPNTTSNIKFSQIPDPNENSFDVITTLGNQYRGRIRKLVEASQTVSEFYITEDMIPDFSLEQDKFITINAYFECDNEVEDGDNPYIQSIPELKLESEIKNIHDLGIKISYLGKCPISIASVRIMTPNCKKLLEGGWDDGIVINVQDVLTKISTQEFINKHQKILRFNNVIEGHTQNWIAERYFNKLVGSLGTGEDGIIYPDRYEYYVKPADRWLGYFSMMNTISAPYSRNVYGYTTFDLMKTMGIYNGYLGVSDLDNGNFTIETDPAKSHYETYLVNVTPSVVVRPISYFLVNPNEMDAYRSAINYGENYGKCSFLAHWEGTLYRSFFSERSRGFLFSDKFWWGQVFNLARYHDDESLTTYFTDHRPFTGEELRLSMWTPIILGAKGLIYDGPIS